MELHDALRAVKRLWPVIVAAALVAVATMWAITPVGIDTTRRVGSYEAVAVLLVQPRTQPITGSASPPLPTPHPAQAVQRVSLLVQTGEIPHRAAGALGEPKDPEALVAGLRVTTDPGIGAVYIAKRGKNADRITEVVNAFAHETVRYFETPRPEVVDGQVTLVDEGAPLPFEPASQYVIPPDRGQRLLIAAFLGLLAGAALAVILGLLDTRIRTARQVRRIIGLPVLAEVPRGTRSQRDPRENPQADAYRIAESTFTSLSRTTGIDVNLILVTSALPTQTVASSVVELAEAFAESGSSVLVVEANLRAPELASALDTPSAAGVADWVGNPSASSLEAIAHPTAIPGVRLISAGASMEPAALASRLGPLLAEARGLADFVIIDAPPLLAASEVYDLISSTDAVLLVVRYNRLTRPVGERVGELLQRFEGPVLGAVLTGVPRVRRRRR